MWSILSKIHLCVSLSLIAILVIRFVLKRWMTPKVKYLLWSLIFIQLIVPFRVVFKTVSRPVETIVNTVVYHGTQIPKVNFESYPVEPIVQVNWFKIIWVCGVCVLLSLYLLLYIREIYRHKRLQESTGGWHKILDELCVELRIKRQPRLLHKDSIPYVFNGLKPMLVVPSDDLYDDEVKKYMLMHELMHIKSCDLVFKFVFMMLCTFMWFNPLVWIALKLFEDDQELKCDYNVLKVLKKHEIKSYGYALLHCNAHSSKMPFAFSNGWMKKKQIGRRIHMITLFSKLSVTNRIIAVGMALVATLTFTIFSPSLAESTNEVAEVPRITFEIDKGYDQVEQEFTPVEVETYHYPLHKLRLTYAFGTHTHEATGNVNVHTGNDLAADMGTNISAMTKGIVTCSEFMPSYGKTVIIDHGDGLESVYAHCDELLVAVGDEVNGGDIIATVGTTGRSTGPHLHFEVRQDDEAIDSLKFLEEKIK